MQLEDTHDFEGPGPERPHEANGADDANAYFTMGFTQFASFNVYHLKLVYY